MSVDNGVYITRWLSKNNSDKKRLFEYRVKHCQAIDNCYYDSENDVMKELVDAFRVNYFSSCEVFKSEKEAEEEAFKIYNKIMEDDGICEYGVSKVNFDVEFPNMTPKDALNYIDSYIGYTNDSMDMDMRFS